MNLESETLARQITDGQFIGDLPFVEVELNYVVATAEKPFTYVGKPPEGKPQHNVVYETHRLPVRDARSLTFNPSLNNQGFSLIPHDSVVSNFDDENRIRQVYYPEAEQLIKEVTGATRVLVFDHNLRNTHLAKQGVQGIREPVKRVHNDFTAKSGHRRARDELLRIGIDNPDAYLQQRFSIVNIWRPIAHPVQESPLAICAATSIGPGDWVASDLIYRERVGETYLVSYNPKHQWFYFPYMKPNEVLLLKCFDSSENHLARFTAHTAFDDPTSPLDAIPRFSIELRSLVFYAA